MVRINLDAREMAHPEPFTHALSHLQQMDEKSYLYMLNRKNPLPLLALAKEKGFKHFSQENSNGEWHILITKNPNCNLKVLLDV